MVVAIPIAAGDEVAEGDVVAIVESMKLETALRAPVPGRVTEVFADVNTQIESGAKLILIEPDSDQDQDTKSDARADLSALAGAVRPERDPAAIAADALAALRHRRACGQTAAGQARRRAGRAAPRRPAAAGRRGQDPAGLRRRVRAVA